MVNPIEGDLIAGVDEVGRGALCGPIVAAAALFRYTLKPPIDGLKDSKLFAKEQKRVMVRDEIAKSPSLISYCICAVYPDDINKLGIDKCNDLVFQRALDGLQERPQWVYVDGIKSVSGWPRDIQWVEAKSDAKYWWVSAASILAKVWRDSLLIEMSSKFPQYKWESNKGYGSGDHLKAIREHGPTPHHRSLFIRNIVGGKRGS